MSPEFYREYLAIQTRKKMVRIRVLYAWFGAVVFFAMSLTEIFDNYLKC